MANRQGGHAAIETLSNHDIGVLLSSAEAGVLSLREFQMLGLGVLAPNVGGLPEMLAPGAGILVEGSAGPQDIAAVVSDLLADRTRVAGMRESAWATRETMTLDETAKGILAALAYRGLLH